MLIKKLSLNNNPEDVNNCSLICAKNIILSDSGNSIVNEPGLLSKFYIHDANTKIVGTISCNEEVVVITATYVNNYINHSNIYRLKKDGTVVEYDNENGANWLYHGGIVHGDFTYNINNELVICIAEYNGSTLDYIPLYSINLDDPTNWITSDAHVLTFDRTCNIYPSNIVNSDNSINPTKFGMYQFYIRYKLNETDDIDNRDVWSEFYTLGAPVLIGQSNIKSDDFYYKYSTDSAIYVQPSDSYVCKIKNIRLFNKVNYNLSCIYDEGVPAYLALRCYLEFDQKMSYKEMQIAYSIKTNTSTEYRYFEEPFKIESGLFKFDFSNTSAIESLSSLKTDTIENQFQFEIPYNVRCLTNKENRIYIANYDVIGKDNLKTFSDSNYEIGYISSYEGNTSYSYCNVRFKYNDVDYELLGCISQECNDLNNVDFTEFIYCKNIIDTDCDYLKINKSNGICTHANGDNTIINIENYEYNNIKIKGSTSTITTLIPGEIYKFYIHFIYKDGSIAGGVELKNRNTTFIKDGIETDIRDLNISNNKYYYEEVNNAIDNDFNQYISRGYFGYYENLIGDSLFKAPLKDDRRISVYIKNVSIPEHCIGYFLSYEHIDNPCNYGMCLYSNCEDMSFTNVIESSRVDEPVLTQFVDNVCIPSENMQIYKTDDRLTGIHGIRLSDKYDINKIRYTYDRITNKKIHDFLPNYFYSKKFKDIDVDVKYNMNCYGFSLGTLATTDTGDNRNWYLDTSVSCNTIKGNINVLGYNYEDYTLKSISNLNYYSSNIQLAEYFNLGRESTIVSDEQFNELEQGAGYLIQNNRNIYTNKLAKLISMGYKHIPSSSTVSEYNYNFIIPETLNGYLNNIDIISTNKNGVYFKEAEMNENPKWDDCEEYTYAKLKHIKKSNNYTYTIRTARNFSATKYYNSYSIFNYGSYLRLGYTMPVYNVTRATINKLPTMYNHISTIGNITFSDSNDYVGYVYDGYNVIVHDYYKFFSIPVISPFLLYQTSTSSWHDYHTMNLLQINDYPFYVHTVKGYTLHYDPYKKLNKENVIKFAPSLDWLGLRLLSFADGGTTLEKTKQIIGLHFSDFGAEPYIKLPFLMDSDKFTLDDSFEYIFPEPQDGTDAIYGKFIYNATNTLSSNVLRRSLQIKDESLTSDEWITFPIDEYKIITENKGKVNNLKTVGNLLIVHCEHSLFRFDTTIGLKTNDNDINIVMPDTFDVNYTEITTSQKGFCGIKDQFACSVGEWGYIWFDEDHKELYSYNNNSLNSLNTSIDYFIKHARDISSVRLGVDKFNDRLLFTFNCADGWFTFSYSFKTGAWLSMHDYSVLHLANAYIQTKEELYLINSDKSPTSMYVFDNYNYNPGDYYPLSKFDDNVFPTYYNSTTNINDSYFDIIFNSNNKVNAKYKKEDPLYYMSNVLGSGNDGDSTIKQLDSIKYICRELGKNNSFSFNITANKNYCGDKLYIYSEETKTPIYDISSVENTPAKNQFNNYTKPYWEKGIWNYNYFRDNKNSNIDTSDTRSLIYGRFIVARFIIDNNRYRFVEFEDVLPILNKY